MSDESQESPATRADLEALKAEILSALSLLLRDPVRFSILTAPADDERYTEEQQRQDSETFAAIGRGEYTSHEEVFKEFGL